MTVLLIKCVGSIMIAFGGVLSACYFNRKTESTLKGADNWLHLLKFIKEQIDSFAMPITEILERCDNIFLEDCGYTDKRIKPRSLKELIENANISDSIVRKSMTAFSDTFGKNERTEQIKECEYYIQLVSERRKYLFDNIAKQKKINTVLSIASALALIILLL